MAPAAHALSADFIYVDGAFRSDVTLRLGADGRIAEVVAGGPRADRMLRGRALLPGFVNAHSHAFQRGLRGRGERFPAGAGSFWTWRNAMYELVESIDAAAFEAVCTQAFREMLAAGFTTATEFHYFHHADADARDFAFDRALCAAAEAAGIRLVCLPTFYATGGFGQPLAGGQLRFATPRVKEFLAHVDALRDAAPATLHVGAAAHSVRAVPADELVELAAGFAGRRVPWHMHVEEQPREISDCEAAWGRRPLRWLLDELPLDARFTAVHCTHSTAGDLERLRATGARVCICPLTEANLGDGIAPLPPLENDRGALCIGSDSNARIDPWEELRWLEYVQRLAHQQRGVLRDEAGATAARLFEIGTVNGAAAVQLPVGRIAPDHYADFIAIDLNHPSLAFADRETLLDAAIFGASGDIVREVFVHGREVTPTRPS